ncbi:MAG: tRNA pseudouridine(55) synthase TruB [Armatimonadetes bacterium]|nr:tRNA pseudouridine(55) synthase TruB [Armatimonadota bacterium]
MHGFLLVLKPPGMTSHDVVQFARRTFGTRAVGHTGTLDPAAAGLLVLTLGCATRLGEFLLDCDKAYRAEIILGLTSDTGDAEGAVTATGSAIGVTPERVATVLDSLTGAITMRPPAHSAVSVGGQRLHRLARAGQAIEAPPRAVTVHALKLLEFLPGERALLRLDVVCSKGTYVRSLAQMIGERLAVGGVLSALLRTQVGPHRLEQAATLEEIAANPLGHLLTPLEGLPHLPRAVLDAASASAFAHGNAIAAPDGRAPEGPLLVLQEDGELLGVGEVSRSEPRRLRPRKVLVSADQASRGRV